MLKLRDIIAAEEALEAAVAAYRTFNNDVNAWSAYESLDKRGMRVLNVQPSHFERLDAARARITAAEQQLLATKRSFFAGVIDRAED